MRIMQPVIKLIPTGKQIEYYTIWLGNRDRHIL